MLYYITYADFAKALTCTFFILPLPLLPDEEGTKVNLCVDNVFKIWKDTADNRSTQLIFCDYSTPKGDGSFNVYDDIRDKLVKLGVPKEEVAFIHEANTDAQKKELFAKMRKGITRILIGSTAKCGAGTNIQDKLIAMHDLDAPWRPRDLIPVSYTHLMSLTYPTHARQGTAQAEPRIVGR